jgi:hypothetical protein
MSEHPTVSGKSLRGVTMSGRSPRVPVNIQPATTRFIPVNQLKRTYESSSDDPESDEEEQHTSVTPQLPTIDLVTEPDEPATEAPVRVRGRAKSMGGVSFTKARGSNKGTYWVNFRGTRRHYYTQEAADAALALFQTGTMCPGCDRAIPFNCSQCGHVDTVPAYQAPINPVPVNPDQVIPVPAPIPVNPDPVHNRCRAIAPGVLSVTINGLTFTTRGDFEYP